MDGEWQEYMVRELQEIAQLLVEDGNHGEYRPRRDEFCEEGTVFIRAADMDHGRILFDSASKINATAVARIRKGIGVGGDVLLSHKGTVGKLAMVPLDAPPFVCSPQTTFWRSLNPDAIDRRYLYAYMHSPHFRQQLDSRKGETDMADYVSLTAQREFRVLLPPIADQRAIAHILGSLDDKIELNRRMNETLETMAQAIFKSWFVDFDPVRAKAEGRDTGLPGEIADLFPDSFEDSEPGAIPRWWEESTIGENAEKLSKGTTPRKQDVSLAGDSPTVPFLKVRNISDSGEIDISSLEKVPRSIHEKALKRSVLKANDVLFSIAGTIGRVTILPMELDDSNTNQAVAFIRPHAHGLPAQFIRLLLISDRIQFEAKSRVVQGVQANVSLTVLSELTFPKPSSELIDVWYRYCGGIFEQQMLLLRESRTLASLRDTLLSKLISGELRVPDAALELVAQAGVPDADKLIEGVGA